VIGNNPRADARCPAVKREIIPGKISNISADRTARPVY
jgi:hypothetical protein